MSFTAHYSNGTERAATITASSSSNPGVATVHGGDITLAGTGASVISFTVEYPVFVWYNYPKQPPECRQAGDGIVYPALLATGDFWDSWPIGSYESQFGTPILDLADADSGTRTDYPLQWTAEDNGSTVFSLSTGNGDGMTEQVTVENPEAAEGGWWPTPGVDGHLIIADTQHRYYWDFYHLVTPNGPSAPEFSAGGEVVAKDLDGTGNYGGDDIEGYENATGNGAPDRGGTTASYMTGFAGTILPGELDCATCINHALAVIVPSGLDGCNGYSGKGECSPGTQFKNPFNGEPEECNEGPATGGDAPNTCGLNSDIIFCEGAKIFLPAGFALKPASPGAQIPVAAQAIANALINYGGIIEDQGSTLPLRFYTAGYYDTDSQPGTIPPGMDYEGVSSSALVPYMQQIGTALRIAYTCASGCTTAP